MSFTDINYLKTGTARQQRAWKVLTTYSVLEKLTAFTPILVGTIPIGIDVENSDLDIICCWKNKNDFKNTVEKAFGHCEDFESNEKNISGVESVLYNFNLEDEFIEIFGQAVPVHEQNAYRHMIVEHHLLLKHGEKFRTKIIKLKNSGYKTEPAFAIALKLQGDPYETLLKLYDDLLNKL